MESSPCGHLLEFGYLPIKEYNGQGSASTKDEPCDSQSTGAALGTGQSYPGRKSSAGNPQQENSRELGVTVGLHRQHALLPYQLATQAWGKG